MILFAMPRLDGCSTGDRRSSFSHRTWGTPAASSTSISTSSAGKWHHVHARIMCGRCVNSYILRFSLKRRKRSTLAHAWDTLVASCGPVLVSISSGAHCARDTARSISTLSTLESPLLTTCTFYRTAARGSQIRALTPLGATGSASAAASWSSCPSSSASGMPSSSIPAAAHDDFGGSSATSRATALCCSARCCRQAH